MTVTVCELEHGPFSSLIYQIKDGDFPLFLVCLPEGNVEFLVVQPEEQGVENRAE